MAWLRDRNRGGCTVSTRAKIGKSGLTVKRRERGESGNSHGRGEYNRKSPLNGLGAGAGD